MHPFHKTVAKIELINRRKRIKTNKPSLYCRCIEESFWNQIVLVFTSPLAWLQLKHIKKIDQNRIFFYLALDKMREFSEKVSLMIQKMSVKKF